MRKLMFIVCVSVIAVMFMGIGLNAVKPATALAESEGVLPVAIQISPQVLILGVQGEWVTVHTDLPYSTVAASSVALNDIPIDVAYADALGYFVAKFDQATIQAIVQPGAVTLTLTGLTKDGDAFAGSETITVNEQGKK